MFQKINNFLSSKKNSNLIKEITNKYLDHVNKLEVEISKLTKEEIISQIENLKQNYIVNIFISFAFISLIIWLKFAYHSSCWVPYQNILFYLY